ncbi:MAG TPA: type VI secretion system tube protein Hcp [Candidatus Udaeobacter sp.]|jgi:type VI secretion system secreted protein Hcp|nr:type VI secretion system tube protein Hcp [Candidatus Udaeobacter sp.]
MAAVDYFLKIDGIQGESKDDRHKDEIDIESFSWGETQSGTFAAGGGGGAGKVSMQDFHFTMSVNKASPALFLACAQGNHIKNAILTCRKGGREEFMKVTMNDVLVSSFQMGGAGGVVPTDQISLNFAMIEVEYKEQDATGKLVGSIKKWFDFKSMKGG